MAVLLDYIWQSIFCMLVFFGIYWVFLRNEKVLQITRIYLLISPIMALILPLVSIPVGFAKPDISLEQTQFYRTLSLQDASDNFVATFGLPEFTVQGSKLPVIWGLKDYFLLFYLAIVFFLSFRIFWMFLQMRLLKEKGWYQTSYNLKMKFFMIPTFGLAPVFSFFDKLFWDDTQELNPEEREQVIKHEVEHIRQGHTYDLIYYQILCMLFWFNPAIHLMRSALVDVHEFLADEKVLSRISNKENYPKLIVKMAFKGIDLPIGNYFVRSTTLKRILMMKKSTKVNWIKVIMVIPMTMILMGMVTLKTQIGFNNFISSNFTSNLEDIQASLKASQDSLDVNIKVKKVENPMHYEWIGALENGTLKAQIGELQYEFSNISSDEEYIKVRGLIKSLKGTSIHRKDYGDAFRRYQVDEAAAPKEGLSAWYSAIMEGIEAPSKEMSLGLGGVIEVEFVVLESGKIHAPVIKTSFGGGLDEKVLQAIQEEPSLWSPAKKQGKPVPMVNSISFAFYPQEQIAKSEAHQFFNPLAASTPPVRTSQDADEIFDVVEYAPEFPGGMEAWNDYLKSNLAYPIAARSNGIEGTVYVVFVINEDGNVGNSEILRGVGFGLDEEALRVVQESPDWNPGIQRGKKVAVRMRVPIKFKLPEDAGTKSLSGFVDSSAEAQSVNALSPRPSEKFQDYMKRNLKYPNEDREAEVMGNLTAELTLNQKGLIQNVNIKSSPSTSIEAEVLRVLEKNNEKWIVDGKKDSYLVEMPITFQIAHLPKVSHYKKPNQLTVTAYGSTNDREARKPKMDEGWKLNVEDGVKFKSSSFNDPSHNVLFIIDGKAMPDFIPNTTLNPDDIQSIEVIKGERASGMVNEFGEKAANGVIIIQTKN